MRVVFNSILIPIAHPTPHPHQRFNHRRQMLPPHILQRHLTPRHRSRDQERRCFNPIRDDLMSRSPQLLHTFHHQRRSPNPLDLRPHLDQHLTQIHHLRLPRRRRQHRLPLRQRRRTDQVTRPRHCRPVGACQINSIPNQLIRLGNDIPALNPNLRPQLRKSLQVKINRTMPNRTSPRQRHNRLLPLRQ